MRQERDGGVVCREMGDFCIRVGSVVRQSSTLGAYMLLSLVIMDEVMKCHVCG